LPIVPLRNYSLTQSRVYFRACVCDSDTLTDVSSLHDLDYDDDIDDDDTASKCTRVGRDDGSGNGHSTSSDAADSLSDLTIPDFTVSRR